MTGGNIIGENTMGSWSPGGEGKAGDSGWKVVNGTRRGKKEDGELVQRMTIQMRSVIDQP